MALSKGVDMFSDASGIKPQSGLVHSVDLFNIAAAHSSDCFRRWRAFAQVLPNDLVQPVAATQPHPLGYH